MDDHGTLPDGPDDARPAARAPHARRGPQDPVRRGDAFEPGALRAAVQRTWARARRRGRAPRVD